MDLFESNLNQTTSVLNKLLGRPGENTLLQDTVAMKGNLINHIKCFVGTQKRIMLRAVAGEEEVLEIIGRMSIAKAASLN